MGKQHSLHAARTTGPDNALVHDEVASVLADAAPAEEAGSADIADSVAVLRQASWLGDDGTSDPAQTVERLRRVGAVNLSVGRLFEGHINALYLAHVHGDARAVAQVNRLVTQGAFLGVWGADGAVPVDLSPDGATLVGQKNFASGLGTVSYAVVTVCSGPDVRLALVDVRDDKRGDPSVWQMQGMRATASGRYDFDGIPVDEILWLGNSGNYLVEPHFVGGVWRIAALQIGGALGLVDAAAASLRARDRLAAPAQMARLSNVAIRALGASALVTRAAIAAAPGAVQTPDQSAAISAAARLLTEEVALDAIRTVEQCLGLGHFEESSATSRQARDLAVYLRQAARDAFQTRVGEACFAQEDRLWTLF
jgi:alkylation response protein AidB-like acyl-CoA dehydrogenase